MEKTIKISKDLQEFKKDLKEGNPFALYDGFVCCGDGNEKYKDGMLVEEGIEKFLEKSKSLVVGFGSCEHYFIRVALDSGKVYVGHLDGGDSMPADASRLEALAVEAVKEMPDLKLPDDYKERIARALEMLSDK